MCSRRARGASAHELRLFCRTVATGLTWASQCRCRLDHPSPTSSCLAQRSHPLSHSRTTCSCTAAGPGSLVCAAAHFQAAAPATGQSNATELAELIESDTVASFMADAQDGLRKTALRRKAKQAARQAAWNFAVASREAHMHPAPHGYGNGFSECICRRCDRAMQLDAKVQTAHAAWMSAAAHYATVRKV